MAYEFEWRREKGDANLRKHGVSFADPLAVLVPDADHSIEEQRYLVLGLSNRRGLLVVAFAERPPRTRLISARAATRRERRQYEEEA